MSSNWWREEQLGEYYTAWQCAVSHVEYLEEQNTRLREELEVLKRSLKEIKEQLKDTVSFIESMETLTK